ncbi:MAG: hypothetical protein NXH95_08135 [Pseudomonadaceae bacterium]|nr:hypothetical protein [Pseudomonadaceae bacterium]
MKLLFIEASPRKEHSDNQKMQQSVDMISGGTGNEAYYRWAGVVKEVELPRTDIYRSKRE